MFINLFGHKGITLVGCALCFEGLKIDSLDNVHINHVIHVPNDDFYVQ